MPMYDRRCTACGNVSLDHWEPITAPVVQCACGEETERVTLPNQKRAVDTDDIPGGILIYNAICNADGSPKRYYSKSEIMKAAHDAGWTNTGNKHVPMRGSDKAKDGVTTRWTATPIPEDQRLKHWHEHEKTLALSVQNRGEVDPPVIAVALPD